MLESSLVALAGLFRAHSEQGLADWIDHTAAGDPERLPQRVLQMFSHGMGGLMDRPLYTDGQLDVSATERRDSLAAEVYDQARARLQPDPDEPRTEENPEQLRPEPPVG